MSYKKTQEQRIPPVIYSDTRTIYSVNVRKSEIGFPKTAVPFPERYIFSNGPLIKRLFSNCMHFPHGSTFLVKLRIRLADRILILWL